MKEDTEAQLIARNDARFLAKLTGSQWCLKQTGTRSSSASPSSAGRESPAAHSPKQQAGSSASPAAHKTSKSPAGLHAAAPQSASGLSPSAAAADVCRPPQHAGCVSACEPRATIREPHTHARGLRSQTAGAASAAHKHKPSTAAGSLQRTHAPSDQLRAQEQQGQPNGCLQGSTKASADSPQWLLRTAQHNAGSAPAGQCHVSSQASTQDGMYTTWAHSQGTDSPTSPASRQATALLSRSQPGSPVPTAAAASGGTTLPRSPSAAVASQPGRSRGVRACSPLRSPSPVAGPEAAACLAAQAAAELPGSPCSSNYHSTRAAGLAAGISRAGAISPEHHEWYMQQHPCAQPPRREDTQQLWQWLADELQQLKQQLQQPLEVQQLEQDKQLQASKCGAAQQASTNKDCSSSSSKAPAAASPSATAAAASSSACRSGSPSLRTRARSPDRMQAGAGAASAAGDTAVAMTDSLEQQAQQLTQLSRGGDSLLQPGHLQLQRDLYSAAFQELCRQVAVGCVERGALMAQLWSAHNVLLEAVLQDRHAVQQQCLTAGQATAEALHEQQLMQQRQQDEKVALRAINERHAAKAEAWKQDFDKLKQQHDNLQELLKRLSGAQQLVQRVMDLEASQQQQALTVQQLQGQVSSTARELETTTAQLMHWQHRAQVAEAQVQQLAQQLGCSTPRPKRDLGLLCDLVEPHQQQLIEQALVGGVPAQQVHRLLLGLSPSGADMRPWLEVAGSCVPALQRAADPTQLLQLLRQHLADCNAAGLAKHLSNPHHLQLLSQAVHVGTDSDTLLQLLTGSLGVQAAPHASPATGAAAGAAGATRCSQVAQPLSSTHTCAAAAAPAAAAAAAVAGLGEGLPLLPLVGVLAIKYGHDARELGGPVTDALQQAQLSTVARVQEMEARCRALHREVVMLKCTLAEQRKHEQERVEAALRDEKRKIARREARQPTPLEKFLKTKWGAVFDGIGLLEELPRVLRANVPINNKHMPKREAEKLASEIWAFKDEHDSTNDRPISLAEATAVFLERRFFAIPRLVTEVAYNLLYSLGQHTYDTDCNLFLRVFSGEVDESVRHEQLLLEGEIMRMLKLLDMSINHQATGWLHKADVKTALTGFFKGKKVDRLADVLEALDTDEPGDALHYSVMFSDDDELNQGLTAEIIRSQHLTERLEFLQEVEDAIRDAAEDNGTTSLTPAMLATCLHKARKGLDSEAVSEYVIRAFGPAWQQQQHRVAQPLGSIIRAVRCGGLPNMVRPAGGPSTVAGAVNRIVPVGKFKTKLVSALKVGFSRDTAAGSSASAGTNAARRNSRGLSAQASTGPAAAAAPSKAQVKSRRATQEAVSAAVAAVLSGDGSKPNRRDVPAAAAAAAASEGPNSSNQLPAVAAEAQTAGSITDATAPAAVNSGLTGAQGLLDDEPAQQGPGGGGGGSNSQSAAEHAHKHAHEHAHSQGALASNEAAETQNASSSGPLGGFAAKLQIQLPDADTPGMQLPAADGALPLAPAAATTCNILPPTPSAAAAAAAGLVATTPSAAASGARSSALARALTVDVLSAMEAVRQSWLKEEGDKLISFSCNGSLPNRASAAAAAAVAATAGSGASAAAASLPGSRLSSNMPLLNKATFESFTFNAGQQLTAGLPPGELLSPRATAPASAARQGGLEAAAAPAGLAGSRRFSAGVVPSLRLLDVLQADSTGLAADGDAALVSSSRGSGGSSFAGGSTYRSSTGSMPGTDRGSSCGTSSCGNSSTGGADSSRGYQQQHSLKSILHSAPEAPHARLSAAKHVHISTADTVFAFCADSKDEAASEQQPQQQAATSAAGSAPASAVSRSQSKLGRQQSGAWEGLTAAQPPQQGPNSTLGAAATGCPLDSADAAEGAPAPAHAAVSRSNSSMNRRHPSTEAPAAAASSPRAHAPRPSKAAADAAGGAAEQPAPSKRRSSSSKSAKHAALLPQLLLTDADDACAAELATPSGADEHAEVCFTPQAPEEGGKRNAFLMRRLNKGKSLQQLEEVMLAVAVGEQLAVE